MTILEPILSRRSIRKYKSSPIEDDKVRAMLESARLAPSGNNTQPWNFIIVHSDIVKKRIVEVCHKQNWMLGAPIFIVCVADIKTRIKEDNLVIKEDSPELEIKLIIRDTAIAIENLVLQAESMGLSTCWVGDFEQSHIRSILSIPLDKYVVAVITVGYPDEKPQARPRKPLKETVYFDIWGRVRTF